MAIINARLIYCWIQLLISCNSPNQKQSALMSLNELSNATLQLMDKIGLSDAVYVCTETAPPNPFH